MAYNTRRTGPQGRGTPPMMYQQQRNNSRTPPAFVNARNPNPPTSNNYQGNVTQNQQHQTQQHATKKEPLSPQQPIKQEPLAPRSTETPNSGTLAPPPSPPPILLKTSSIGETDVKEEENGEAKGKTWTKKKVPGYKVNKKVKRRRQNARLRKILQPKNAIMVLNELKSGIKFSFQESSNSNFLVIAEIEGKTFTGEGISKPLAKQEAAENALKDLLLHKMSESALKAAASLGEGEAPEAMVTDTASSMGDNDSVDGGTESGKPTAGEDEVPWGSLASFALYKLFTEWQSQGTHVHIAKVSNFSPGQSPKPIAPQPMKKIPDNPTERHPVMLLNQLKPGVEFKEISREGAPPNLVFTLSVTIDGVSYTGVAKNKKDAKKEAAKAALAGSFNIKYD